MSNSAVDENKYKKTYSSITETKNMRRLNTVYEGEGESISNIIVETYTNLLDYFH